MRGFSPASAARGPRRLLGRGHVAGASSTWARTRARCPIRRRAIHGEVYRVADPALWSGAGLGGGTPVSSPGGHRPERGRRASWPPSSTGTSARSIAACPFRAATTGRTRPRGPSTTSRARRRPSDAGRGRAAIKDDQDHLIHPLHHPSDTSRADRLRRRARRHASPTSRATSTSTASPGSGTSTSGHGRDRAGRGRGRADAARSPTPPPTPARPTSRPSSSPTS